MGALANLSHRDEIGDDLRATLDAWCRGPLELCIDSRRARVIDEDAGRSEVFRVRHTSTLFYSGMGVDTGSVSPPTGSIFKY